MENMKAVTHSAGCEELSPRAGVAADKPRGSGPRLLPRPESAPRAGPQTPGVCVCVCV